MRSLVSRTLLAAFLLAVPAFAQKTASKFPPVPPSAAEIANARVALAWFQLCFEEGHADRGFPLYASPDYHEHGDKHPGDVNPAPGYTPGTYFPAMKGMMRAHLVGALHPRARAVADLVAIYSDMGVDLVRVRDGRITDHWDISPPIP